MLKLDVSKSDMLKILPFDILLYIASYLKLEDIVRMSGTCKSWHAQLTLERRFWKVLNFTRKPESKVINANSFKSLVDRAGGLVTDVRLIGCVKISNSSFRSLLTTKCVNLETLYLQDVSISVDTVVELIRTLERVRSVEKRGKRGLKRLLLILNDMKPKHLCDILNASPNLMELTIACRWNDMHARKEWKMDRASIPLNSISLVPGDAETIRKLAELSKNSLKTLRIVGFNEKLSLTSLRENLQVLKQCFKLSTIEIGNDVNNWDPVFSEIANPSWNIFGATDLQLSDVGLAAICRNADRLSQFSLNQVSVQSLAPLQDHASSITSLSLINCYRITSEEFLNILQKLEKLEILDLSMNPLTITDRVLETISRNLIHLKSLNLKSCTSIHGYHLHELITNCPGLKMLDISQCPNISLTLYYRLKALCDSRNIIIKAIL